MTGDEYLTALRRDALVSLRHDLRNGEGTLLAPAGRPFLARLEVTEWDAIVLIAEGTAPDGSKWRVQLATGDLHDEPVAA